MNIPPVTVIDHPTCPVEVWRDEQFPDAPVIAVDVDYPGRDHNEPVFVPVEIAREVAAAIVATIPE